jgi:hypothetical protein
VGAVVGLTPLAHGGAGGLAVELAVVIGLAALVVAVVVQSRREAAEDEKEEAAEAASSSVDARKAQALSDEEDESAL